MGSILKSVKNARAILPDSLRFIRSDVPANIGSEEIRWLISENILTVIDLREESERAAKPCPLENMSEFTYENMPVSGGNAVPETADGVAKSYINMADDNMKKIIDRIMSARSGVLYFCNAGKDRTGVVSAILLRKLGYDDEYIIEDYLKSAENPRETLALYAESSNTDINIITPKREYMEKFLDWLKKQ